MKVTMKTWRHALLAIGLVGLPACQDKPADTKDPSATAKKAAADHSKSEAGGEEDSVTSKEGKSEGDAGFNLCAGLKKGVAGDTATALKSQLAEYCDDESISTLRSKDYVYAGTGTVSLAVEDPVTNGDTTKLKIFTSMLIPTNPTSYFNMMKLSLTEPSKFRDKEFKYDDAISINVSGKSDVKSTFTFTRDAQNSDEVSVAYEAKAYFITLKEDSAYAIATVSTKGIKTVKSLKVLALILKKGSKTEVFSISEQTFENQGKADSAVTKYKARISSEVKKNFENGTNASKADE